MINTILVLLILFTFGLVGNADYQEAEKQESIYCQMVAQWEEGKRLGVPEADRAGWPPYDGECADEKVHAK